MVYLTNDLDTVRARRKWLQLSRSKQPKTWTTFYEFLEDVGTPPERQVLLRKNEKNPHSKDNSYWGAPKDRPGYVPRGSSAGSLRSQALAAGLPYQAVYYRVVMGWPLDKALSTPVRRQTKTAPPAPAVVEESYTPPVIKGPTVKWNSKKEA